MSSVRRMTVLLILFCFLGVVADPALGQVTAPEQFLGFKPGADYHLAAYEQAIGYWEKLAGETDRMQVLEMGSTPLVDR